MPEGDTIHKVAAAIAPRLEGAELEMLSLRGRELATLRGAKVTCVIARGKHLFIDTDRACSIRSHLGMHGSWHRYGVGERWKRPARQAGLVLHTARDVFVCFNPKQVELLDAGSVRERIARARIGPDLIADDADGDELTARVHAFHSQQAAIVDVLLDQRIASGIGNVYKSELLFIERVSPRACLADVTDERLRALYACARRLLGANLGGGRRVTRFERDGAGRLWVYRRDGAPCLHCEASIVSAYLGRSWRSTYWCPQCQATPA